MIKVLRKGFAILEYLAERSDTPVPLREIAGQFDMHPATCANIIRTMMDCHYVEQVAPKKGYLLGPALFRMVRQAPYRKDLVAVAEPLVAKLARSVDETVMLVILRLGRRCVLAQTDGKRAIQVGAQALLEDNVYETATGRLLLAHETEQGLETIVRERGLPGTLWPEVKSESALKRELAGIRRKGWVVRARGAEVTALAFPVRNDESRVVAALGLFLPTFRFKGAHRNTVLSGMRRTASAIGEALCQQSKEP